MVSADFPQIQRGQTCAMLFVSQCMKSRMFLTGLAALVLLAPVAVMAADDSPLAKEMEKLDDAFKAFRKESDAAKGAVQAREAQQAAVRGFMEIPTMISKMPDGPEKEKAAAQYRLLTATLLVKLCEVENKFLAGDVAGVEKLVADLKDLRKKGHNQFMEDEEE